MTSITDRLIDKFIEYETARPTYLAYEFQTLRSVQKEFFSSVAESMSKFKVTRPHEGEPTGPLVAPLEGSLAARDDQDTRMSSQPRHGPRGRHEEDDDDGDDDDDDDGNTPRGRTQQTRQASASSFRRPTPGASQGSTFKGPKKSPFGNASSKTPEPVEDEEAPQPPRRPAKGVYALVIYDFPGTDEDELPLREGQKVRVTRQHPSGWWTGEINGKIGIFPATYVKLL